MHLWFTAGFLQDSQETSCRDKNFDHHCAHDGFIQMTGTHWLCWGTWTNTGIPGLYMHRKCIWSKWISNHVPLAGKPVFTVLTYMDQFYGPPAIAQCTHNGSHTNNGCFVHGWLSGSKYAQNALKCSFSCKNPLHVEKSHTNHIRVTSAQWWSKFLSQRRKRRHFPQRSRITVQNQHWIDTNLAELWKTSPRHRKMT